MSVQVFTVDQVAERLGVTHRTVVSWIRSGELRAFDASRRPNAQKPRYRITGDALAAFEAARTATPAPSPAHTRPRRTSDVVEFYG